MRNRLLRPSNLLILISIFFFFVISSKPVCAVTSDNKTKLIERFCESKKMRAFLKRQRLSPSLASQPELTQKPSRQDRFAVSDNRMIEKKISNVNKNLETRVKISEENCQEMIAQLSPKEFIKNLRENREDRPGFWKKIRLFIGIDKISK